ncbi:MAG: urea carboxylase, partial [Solirubrobacteraceae bacterium]|nr:urea carboxylase [Solirubrobacteraceae bacterium]
MTRVLVANRGEIACRIIRSAHALGWEAVAVFSDADRGAPHVGMADDAVRLGPAAPRASYLDAAKLVRAALDAGCAVLHPGYGLLSEDAPFARAVEAAGIAFAGPTPAQLEAFGAKDRARALAREAGVPMLDGSGVLTSSGEAVAAAEAIGFPVMLKATAGGGGIGLAVCHDAAAVPEAFARVGRVAGASFGAGGVFCERYVAAARHVEVQVFGDGTGRVLALGDRDCTLQRRNQKVIEEAPAPGLPDALRDRIAAAAVDLCAAASYRSAGTVEFVYDGEREEASFLEVNARLQVEHPVTEATHTGLDLVAWMLRLATGDGAMLDGPPPAAAGCAVEARVYAEDPGNDHRPSPGLITNVEFPDNLRVDGWVAAGTEVTSAYDPLLAKLVATGATRADALDALAAGLARTRVDGVATNLALLRAALAHPAVRAVEHTTATLAEVVVDEPRIDVLCGGTLTTLQDWPGRTGLWHVGVPPSGPMDDRSMRLANRALGNPEGTPALECTLQGPALRFSTPALVCVGGAEAELTVDGEPVERWVPFEVPAGATLDVGPATGRGLRTYVCVAGGFDVAPYLGSAATFTLGRFGGHGGRELRAGDVLAPGTAPRTAPAPVVDPPALTSEWEIAVLDGPHAAPEFFTPEDIEALHATAWRVHFNSARTGVRLVGPRPRWAREDGGEAGLHPSNIHDTPYAIGALDFTGDVPILLGPDGPSLGGFVCPVTVVRDERWKLGQLRPGDTVRFRRSGPSDGGVLARRSDVTYRRSGDDNLLVEFGEMTLDLGLRMRVHALQERLAAEALPGIVDLTPGIRSLQVHVDPDVLALPRLLGLVRELEDDLPPTPELEVPSRIVHLPLSWDDPATREATERYMAGVRDDAPWCPWNIEFIRRVNGLDSV